MLIQSRHIQGSRQNVIALLLVAVSTMATILFPRQSCAQTSYTWNRTGNSSWKNNINWLPNVNNQSYPHLLGDSATFNLNTATAAATPALNANVTVSAITVNAAPNTTNYGLTIGPGTPTTSILTLQTSSGNATYTENADPADGTGTTIINAPLQLNSNLDVYQYHNITANSSTDFTALLSAGSGIALTKYGNGNLQLDAAPSGPGAGFQGNAVINAGAIRLTNNVFANATGVSVNSGGQLELAPPSSGTVTSFALSSGAPLVLNGAGKDSSTANYAGALRFDSQSVAASFDSPVQLATDSHIFVDANLTPPSGPVIYGTLTLTQSVSGPGALTVDGPGVLTLANANSYGSGGTATTVSTGSNLLVTDSSGSATGSGAVVVHGTLGGSGAISGSVNFGGGTLAPSFASATPSTLSLGSTSFDALSTLSYQLGVPGTVGGGINDLTHVSGNLTLAGTLNVTGLTGFGVGSYELFTYSGSLTDSGLAFGTLPAGFAYHINESTTGVVALDVSAISVLQGDVNHDGVVNGLDIAAVASSWLQTGGNLSADANNDGVINGLDIALIASHWLATSGAGSGAGPANAVAVPEPGSGCLLITAAISLVTMLQSRRWRR